jgi:hydroxymethylbilane synthase
VRRQAQALRARADLNVVLLRGNVGTRLAKLAAGEADAIILARAGLERLGSPPRHEVLDGQDWLPALCQGVIGIEVRRGDRQTRDRVAAVDHAVSAIAIAAERGFLATLDGSCRTPIAGLARVQSGRLQFSGEVLAPNGRTSWKVERTIALAHDKDASLREAAALGRTLGEEIRSRAGSEMPAS